ncbi:MAG UNVERIFIED_CONTAM: hypothetical protein LVR18_13375 [Planctomycetaceae bacterium]|jgi:hypothetical protein
MIAISGIVAAVIVCVALDWWLYVWSQPDPPEQRHDVLTGDQGDECMEGSFEEW